jgi:sugar lactone lactonase YvrE
MSDSARRSPVLSLCEVLEPRTLMCADPISAGGHKPTGIMPLNPWAQIADQTVVGQLGDVTPLTVSTIPSNGDVNPYGLAFVPKGFSKKGALRPGDLLVSNFNASSGLQGTGTTIDRIRPDGTLTTFFQGQAPLGLTTALGILRSGFVIVGNMPTTDGTSATVQAGSLLVIDKNGHQVAQITDTLINGPWDMAIDDDGRSASLFVSSVLSGTVVRVDVHIKKSGLTVESIVQIASGYTHQPDPAALELGPTGLAFDDRTNTLFVASTADNEIFSVANAEHRKTDAGTGAVIINDQTHLHGPLGLVLAPNGDLIVANGDAVNADPAQPSEIVEFTPKGTFVAQFSIDPNVDAPFGIAITSTGNHVRFAAVNDNQNTVSIWDLKLKHHKHSHGDGNDQGDNGHGDGNDLDAFHRD